MNVSSPNQTPNFQKKRQAFTLIELLVVIAIIAILAGLLLPAAQNAFNSAYKTTAKNQAVQIATAITAYETEYGRLPSNSVTTVGPSLVTILCTTNDANNNPRGLLFLDSSTWKKGKGGTNSSGFCDPFNSNSVYSVALDTNYANTITVPYQSTPGGATNSTNITKHIGVWTIWTNGTQKTIINSWD
jgi:prepilin-type N-terminal cleavage/methylation domain-containing protein